MSESYISVVTEELITCGTLLGPLPLSSGSPDSLAVLTWRCSDKLTTSKQVIKVTLKDQFNSRGLPKIPSWLAHILPARKPEEQTLEIVVKGGQLYFRSLRDIDSGEELRAWFGQDLADILKLPMIPPNVVEGEKRFECMLCQEQFENPFPVVAHLMYRCRRKDHGLVGMHDNPFRKKNSGGRVKNFNIATLTDMSDRESESNDEVPSQPSPIISDTNHTVRPPPDEPQLEPGGKRKKKVEDLGEYTVHHKKSRSIAECDNAKTMEPSIGSPPRKSPPNGAFKLTSSSGTPTYHPPLYTNVDLNHVESNSSSAFKKVDKSNAAFHTNITSISSLFTGGLDPRELLFQTGPNSFAPFPYPLATVTSAPSYGGVTLSQNGMPPVSHPVLNLPPMDGHMTSAFAPSTKLSTTSAGGGNMHPQLKMAEEYKIMRKIPSELGGGYEISHLMPPSINGARMPPGLQYPPKPQSMDVFGGAKALQTPLLPFLPPSLAALSFPSQNWCAKCNASFRMTSDLVYHMRSHHKRETDPQKLKREEKLRCHICNETFRERHHLTRHMTSHQ